MDASEHAQAVAVALRSARERESLYRRPVGLHLEVLQGADEGKRFELPRRDTITGGRASSHDVVLTDSSVSTNHFELRLTPGGVLLRDLGSTNGTWLGRAQLVDGTVSLFDGATFHAGDVKLRLARIEVASIARSERSSLGTMTGTSPAIREIFALLDRIGPTPLTTLITGEAGTGKEEVARTLHELSGRSGPFIVLDCGTLPLSLAESAILGHIRGAFSGAHSNRRGAFEAANGGTVLLDEIGKLPLALQPKLLRVLERREVEPVGSNERRPVDVRVLAATHRNLASLAAEGKFRLDLLHRLRQIEVFVPPLRERAQDIPVLARTFLEQLYQAYPGHVASDIDDDALTELERRRWEGNVRELRQLIEALGYLAHDGSISLEDVLRFGGRSHGRLPSDAGLFSLPYKEAIDEFTHLYLAELEEAHRGAIEPIRSATGYTRRGLRSMYARLGRPWPADRDDGE